LVKKRGFGNYLQFVFAKYHTVVGMWIVGQMKDRAIGQYNPMDMSRWTA